MAMAALTSNGSLQGMLRDTRKKQKQINQCAVKNKIKVATTIATALIAKASRHATASQSANRRQDSSKQQQQAAAAIAGAEATQPCGQTCNQMTECGCRETDKTLFFVILYCCCMLQTELKIPRSRKKTKLQTYTHAQISTANDDR